MNLIEIIVALGSLGMSAVAFIAATRAQTKSHRLEQVKVDAEAYERAQHIYDSTIEQLRKDNERLADKVVKLETKIEKLESALHAQEFPIPPDGDGSEPTRRQGPP